MCAALPQQRPNDYGIPVAVEVTYVQDNFLTSDVLNEMVKLQADVERCRDTAAGAAAHSRFPPQMLLVDYYRAAPDLIHFSQYWCPDTTMLDKIKVTRGFEGPPVASGPDPCCPPPSPQGSLSCHAPKDQAYSQILEHVYSQLGSMR